MTDKSELSRLVDAELAKMDGEESVKEEVKSEASVDEVTSESTSEQEEVGSDEQEVGSTESSDPYLKEAIEMGYDPNHKGLNKKSAEQFVKDGSFFKKIDAQKKELQELKAMMKQQIEHTKKVEKAAADLKLMEAQQEKINMVNQGDVDGYKLAEAKEAAARELVAKNAPAAPEAQESEALKEFVARNSTWCNFDTAENRNMAEDADLIVGRTAQRNPGKSEKEILEMAEDVIKKLYPHRFENVNLKKPSMVAKSTSGGSVKAAGLAGRLTPRQQEFAKMAKRVDSSFSIEQYAKELKLTGELRDE